MNYNNDLTKNADTNKLESGNEKEEEKGGTLWEKNRNLCM